MQKEEVTQEVKGGSIFNILLSPTFSLIFDLHVNAKLAKVQSDVLAQPQPRAEVVFLNPTCQQICLRVLPKFAESVTIR